MKAAVPPEKFNTIHCIKRSNRRRDISKNVTTSPAIIAPNQEATYTLPFSTDDMGGYTGQWSYTVRVVSQ